jgi:hypothetical protein
MGFGQQERSTMGSGQTQREMDMESTTLQLGLSMMASGRTTYRKEWEHTGSFQGRSMKGIGREEREMG